MPTLSASEYTKYVKLKAAATAYANGAVPSKIQTGDQVVPVASILNAEVLASQAAFVTNRSVANIVGNARVQPRPVPQSRANPDALSTLSWTSGTSGSVSTTTSSKLQQPGGLPINRPGQTVYTRLPQNAGWTTGSQVQL